MEGSLAANAEPNDRDPGSKDSVVRGSAGEVFRAFLKLGITSFGGPIAHLGYFRDEMVVHRRWIDEAGYADLVALCQFLPGPASVRSAFPWVSCAETGFLAASRLGSRSRCHPP